MSDTTVKDVIERSTTTVAADGTIVRKSYDTRAIKGFKKLDDGSGGFAGYANPFGQLDSVGDITMPGAFTTAIPSFLANGFNPIDHTWSFEKTAAYPVAALEDSYGLFMESRFHSTQFAQDMRTVAFERLDAGLTVKLSIGFTLARFEYVSGADAVQYLIDPTPDDVARCEKMARVRLIHEVKELFEVSLVSVPAAMGSDVVGVKTRDNGASTTDTTDVDTKGQHLGDFVEESAAVHVIENYQNRLMWRVVYDVLFDSGDTPVQSRIDLLSEAMMEMHDGVVRIVGALLASKDTPEGKAAMDIVKAELTTLLETKSTAGPPLDRTAYQESVEVLAAITAHAKRERNICDLYLKAGRRYSAATTERVSTHISALRQSADDLESMLREGMPDGDTTVTILAGASPTTAGAEAKADTTTDATATATESATTTDTTATVDATTTDDAATAPGTPGDEPQYIDPDEANALYAAFITQFGTHD